MEEDTFVPTVEELTDLDNDENSERLDEVASSLKASEQLKQEGNEFFKQKNFEKSLEKYVAALKASHPSCCTQMAVYHCNSAACYIKLGRFDRGRAECDQALALDGKYVKALMRRILCLEHLEQEEEADGKGQLQRNWDRRTETGSAADKNEQHDKELENENQNGGSDNDDGDGDGARTSTSTSSGSTEESNRTTDGKTLNSSSTLKKNDYLQLALEDCKRWLEIEPGSCEAAAKKKDLEGKMKVKQEKLQEEVMGKLKDFGNTILGKFGLSLDNFNAEKDPQTGSYSINFKK